MDDLDENFDMKEAAHDLDGVNFDAARIFIVRRRDMSFVSDYFRRDARRYDNGFELY